MKKQLIRFVTLRKDESSEMRGEEAFGILESLVVLALIMTVIVSLNQYFIGSRDQVLYQKARLDFEEDILRLMMITEENSVCEHLSFINKVNLGSAPRTVLAKLSSIELDGMPIIEVKKKKRYEVKSIELMQDSIFYAVAPTRVRGSIRIKTEYYDRYNKPIASVPEHKKQAYVDIILASDSGGPITSCYGSFSRRIACKDGNGLYNAEAQPNCVF
ncbi:MAG: hypothetical protein V4655_03915 [Bdellovibrionota bacterium]